MVFLKLSIILKTTQLMSNVCVNFVFNLLMIVSEHDVCEALSTFFDCLTGLTQLLEHLEQLVVSFLFLPVTIDRQNVKKQRYSLFSPILLYHELG